MKRLERITYWNDELKNGMDIVFVMQENQIVTKHVDCLTAEDWRR